MDSKKTAIVIVGILSFALSGMETAHGQWTITGTTVGGGNVVVGDGSTLGPLSQTTQPALSSGGFDSVTLNPGSVATASGMDTIAFSTPNNTLVNYGTLLGAGGANYGDPGVNALSFINSVSSVMSGETATNSGVANGGNGSSGYAGIYDPNNGGNGGNGASGGNGMVFSSVGSFNGISLTNNGTAAGGGGGGGGTSDYRTNSNGGDGASGGTGIMFSSIGSFDSVSLTNNGAAAGGAGGWGGYGGNSGHGGNGSIGGSGIGFSNSASLSGLLLTNNGSATGGHGGEAGAAIFGGSGTSGNGGSGIDFHSNGNISNLFLINNCSATGGDGADGIYVLYALGGKGGMGIGITNTGSISNISLENNGSATGGNGGDFGIAGGGGIGFNSTGNISDITLTNSGFVIGGQDAKVFADLLSANGGNGIEFSSSANGSISRIRLTNNGSVVGGLSLAGQGGSAISLNCAGSGSVNDIILINSGTATGGRWSGGTGNGIVINSSGSGGMSNISLTNTGDIAAGDNGGGAAGICVLSNGSASNLTITNKGIISGGDSGNAGIYAAVNGLTIHNHGSISTGSWMSAAAIVFDGDNNTVNLLDHSTVSGLIQATGTNNMLNFAFSDVTVAQKSDIQNQLGPYLNGLPSSGSATILGVNYTWDSLIIQSDLSVIGTFSNWIRPYFTLEQQHNQSISGPEADPDSDGLNNLLEYFSGTNPMQSTPQSGLIICKSVESGGSFITLTFPQAQGITDTSYTVQTSDTLDDGWADTASQEVSRIQGNGVDTVTVKVLTPIDNVGRRFYRLKVMLNN